MNIRGYELTRRGGNVTRYHCYRTNLTDTVGHHTFNLLGILMACLRPDQLSLKLVYAAHQHDVPECVVGDLPAPTKRLPGMGAAMALREAEVLEEHGLKDWADALTPAEQGWLKMADALDGLAFCVDERRTGSSALDAVAVTYVTYIETLLERITAAEGFEELYRHLMKELTSARG